MPGVSLVSPNQFLKVEAGSEVSHLSLLGGCVLMSPRDLPIPAESPVRSTEAPPCARRFWKSLPGPWLARAWGLHALSLTLPCKLLLILQSPRALLQDAPLSTDFSLKQNPVGKVATPLFGLFYTCLRCRHPPPPLPHETFWQNFCISVPPSATPSGWHLLRAQQSYLL